MKMFELLPRPLGSIFRKLTHLTCNSRSVQGAEVEKYMGGNGNISWVTSLDMIFYPAVPA